ncbi:hypothetical protein EYC98_12295 [Halieaceae bacterium IMCC14734]|uniref:Uncharacterized protein n=1 Tax=Candidatus Litorirhabdus singularis TaxID=2518993 RepID=A0ABT3TH48_9GAMM|nr:hypothetical protein [Candidatus Litorirhabdus singularis]MCX2981643.1 hypothetical protein [Candidatus Litorirhabdus singularis]
MTYLLLLSGLAVICWIAIRTRELNEHVNAGRDVYWQDIFDRAATGTERGVLAYDLCEKNPGLDADREHFADLCYRSQVTPDMAATAWVERALAHARKA